MAPPPGRSPRGTSSSAARAGTRHAVTSHARSTARRRPRREHPTPDPPMRDHAAMGTGRQQLRPHTRDTPRLDATRYSTSPTPVNAHCTRSLRNSSPRTTLLRRVARMRAAGAGSGIHARTAHTKYAHASPRPRWLRPRLRGVHPTIPCPDPASRSLRAVQASRCRCTQKVYSGCKAFQDSSWRSRSTPATLVMNTLSQSKCRHRRALNVAPAAHQRNFLSKC